MLRDPGQRSHYIQVPGLLVPVPRHHQIYVLFLDKERRFLLAKRILLKWVLAIAECLAG
jgi:hypothetical protein